MSSLKLDSKYPNTFHIFSDGSFRPPDNAAYSYLIYSQKSKSVIKMETYAQRGATINQMELQAINKALDFPNMHHVVIYSDSSYAIMSLMVWRKSWKKYNWITPSGQPVKNKELIIEIGEKLDKLKFVRFQKVKAHSGNEPYNDIVDFNARSLTLKMTKDPSIVSGLHEIS